MKKTILHTLIEALVVLAIHSVLLHALVGTNIVAGVFCPGPHLPHHYPVLIILFILSRLYVVLLPGIVLSRLASGWLDRRLRSRKPARPMAQAD